MKGRRVSLDDKIIDGCKGIIEEINHKNSNKKGVYSKMINCSTKDLEFTIFIMYLEQK